MARIVLLVVALAVGGCGMAGKMLGRSEQVAAEAPANEPAHAPGALASKGGPLEAAPKGGGPVEAPSAPAPVAAAAGAPASGLDTHAIEEATGLTGATMADGVFRITKPRGDLKVGLDGFAITPRMGLAGWIAFRAHASGALLLGVLPVAADELQAVVSALANAGLEPTALHAHFVGEEPRIAFVHFDGLGNAVALARGVRDVMDAIVRVRAARPQKPAAVEPRSDLDVAKLDGLLGLHGDLDGQVYRASAPRADLRFRELGVDLGPTTSPTSWAAVQGNAERAAVAGEVVLMPTEVPGVVHALREAKIGVTGIYDESARIEPRVVVVSFWGVGRADALAAGVRRALDQLPRG